MPLVKVGIQVGKGVGLVVFTPSLRKKEAVPGGLALRVHAGFCSQPNQKEVALSWVKSPESQVLVGYKYLWILLVTTENPIDLDSSDTPEPPLWGPETPRGYFQGSQPFFLRGFLPSVSQAGTAEECIACVWNPPLPDQHGLTWRCKHISSGCCDAYQSRPL